MEFTKPYKALTWKCLKRDFPFSKTLFTSSGEKEEKYLFVCVNHKLTCTPWPLSCFFLLDLVHFFDNPQRETSNKCVCYEVFAFVKTKSV